MEKTTKHDSDSNASDLNKKPYVAPKLEALGSFVDLTQTEMSVGEIIE